MQADKPFPKEYFDDPKRRAEHRVYRHLAESDRPGLFIFEWKKDKESSEVDFVVWLRNIGIFALQAKGDPTDTSGRMTNGNCGKAAVGKECHLPWAKPGRARTL